MGPKKAKLLLVDDEPLQLKVLNTMVDTLPYALEVVSCTNGQEAIDYLENPNNAPLPDIIITDYLMPVVNGLELLAYVRKHTKYKSVSVLMVSALDEPDIQETALELGVDDFLRRPLNRYELQARCNSFIHFPQHVKGTLEHAVFYEQRLSFRELEPNANNNAMLEVFTRFLSAQHHYPETYLLLLSDITEFISKQLNLDEYLCEQMSKAVTLHGVGFLLKDESGDNAKSPYQLCNKLFENQSQPLYQLAAEICSHQDEYFDGSGVPDKLAGVNIPLAARIASISIFIATQASGSEDVSTIEAKLTEVNDLSGSRFDPELVQIIQENAHEVTDMIYNAVKRTT